MGICCHFKEASEPPLPIINFKKEEKHNEELTQEKLVIALYSLEAKNEAVLSFAEGDKLIIEDDSDPDWYLACHREKRRKGYAPKSYLTLDTEVGKEEWFFGDITRADAERLLFQSENVAGTFLVRNSSIPGAYALCVKDFVPKMDEIVVRHYLIKHSTNNHFVISIHPHYSNSTIVTFSSLQKLVAHFKKNTIGQCRELQKPCRRSRPCITEPLPPNREEYEIPYDSLHFISSLGKGNFGVFYGYWNGTVEVAIKCLLDNNVQAEDVRREISAIWAIKHPKIIRLFAISTNEKPLCIVMEYMCNESLNKYLNTDHGKQLRLPSLVNMVEQISDAMMYLESKNIVHKDLAARNILVGVSNIVKLADFGLERIIDDKEFFSKGRNLSVKWTAPEAYVSGEFTIKSDVWSFGIVLYEIFTHGRTPYPGMKPGEILEQLEKNYRMPKHRYLECSEAIYNIMLFCWKKNPEERPTFEYLYSFFSDYYVASEKAHVET